MFETIFISFITYYMELQFLTAVSGRKRCEVHARTQMCIRDRGGEEARSVFGLGFEFHVGVVEVAEVYVEHILKIAYNRCV